MGGMSVPIGSKTFAENHSPGFNFNINLEHTVSEAILLGAELDFANHKGSYTETYSSSVYNKESSYQFIAADAYMKLQNNLARNNEFQFYLKAGGGLYMTAVNKGLGGGGIVILFAPGINYMTGHHVKLTSALEYRYNSSQSDWSASLLQFKLGFSFCMNPK